MTLWVSSDRRVVGMVVIREFLMSGEETTGTDSVSSIIRLRPLHIRELSLLPSASHLLTQHLKAMRRHTSALGHKSRLYTSLVPTNLGRIFLIALLHLHVRKKRHRKPRHHRHHFRDSAPHLNSRTHLVLW